MKLQRVGAAEAAVHALALLQGGVGHLDAAGRRIAAAGREGAEIDDDRRHAA